MIIAISTLTFDLEGALILRGAETLSKVSSVTRRLRKTATLDGGVTIENNGLSQGDRRFLLTVPLKNVEQYDNYLYLIENYPEVHISTREGFFLGVMAKVNRKSENALLDIEIKSKIT